MSVDLPPIDEEEFQTMEIKPVVQPLVLMDHQRDHFARIIDILSRFYFYQDSSVQGTGKSFIAAAVAIRLQLPVIVVCPLGVRHVWRDVFATHGISTYELEETGGIISYDTLRSRKGSQPKHDLLTRDDTRDGVKFYPTPTLNEIIRAGVLFIFDESQKLKNTSGQSKAAKAILQAIYQVGGKSRVGFLSGTPIDKPIQVVELLRRVKFINQPKLYSRVRGTIRLEGVNELHQWGNRVNRDATVQFMAANPFPGTQKGAVEYVYNFFLRVIKPGTMSIMPNPLDGNKDIKNGFYYMSPEDEIAYRKGVTALANATHFNPELDFAIMEKDNMGAITNAQKAIQIAKVNTAIRVAKQDLEEVLYNGNGDRVYNKVLIFADYYDAINPLLEGLAEYNPIELTGRISEKKREENINIFQDPSTRCRVLIGNPKVGGVGINLHDKDGRFPRKMYIFPTYDINTDLQSSDRTNRIGVVGKVFIRFFYGQCEVTEMPIINAINRKGETMMNVTIEQTESGAIFPNQFEDEIEPLPDDYIPLPANETNIPTGYFQPNVGGQHLGTTQTMINEATEGMANLTVNIPE